MASVRTDSSGQVVRAPREQPGLIGFMQKHEQDFARVLPKHMTPERMTRLAISAIRTTKGLDRCSIQSFASAMMACSTLGLEPNTPLGHAYLIPYKTECQLIVGYKGLTELMYRSGIVASVRCTPVFEGDEFDFEFGLHPDIKHKPSREPGRWDPRKLQYVYPVVRLREQGLDPIFDVLSREQIEIRKGRSASAKRGNSPWQTDYVAMALKTGVRSIATWVPSSAERTMPLTAAVAYEDAVERGQTRGAIAALGNNAAETLHELGAFPTEDDAPEEQTEPNEEREREPGED